MHGEITVHIIASKKNIKDSQEINKLAENLANTLNKLDGVYLTKLPTEDNSSGIKGAPTSSSCTFIAQLAGASGVANLISVAGSWLARDRTRTLKFQIGTNSIEATGLTKEEQQQLIKWFQIQAGSGLEQ